MFFVEAMPDDRTKNCASSHPFRVVSGLWRTILARADIFRILLYHDEILYDYNGLCILNHLTFVCRKSNVTSYTVSISIDDDVNDEMLKHVSCLCCGITMILDNKRCFDNKYYCPTFDITRRVNNKDQLDSNTTQTIALLNVCVG